MCKIAKVCDISTVMCGNEKGHSPPRHYVSCILKFDYHFCLPFLFVSMVVMWCSSRVPPNAFYQNFKDFSFESATRFENASPNYHSGNIHVSGRLFQLWPVRLSPTSFTTFGGKSPYIYMLYIYSWKKKLFEKIVVEMVKMVEVPSYHTNSPTTFTDSHEFLLLWEKHEGTVWQYTGIHLPKSIHPYTRNIDRACIKKCWTDSTVHAYIQVCQKMHEHGHVWYWTVNDAVT